MTKTCPNCGQPNLMSYTRCSRCGAVLKVVYVPRCKKRRGGKGLWLLLALSLFFLLPLTARAHTSEQSSFAVSEDGVFCLSPGVTPGQFQLVVESYRKIPLSVRKQMVKDGIRIYIIAEEFEDLGTKRNEAGEVISNTGGLYRSSMKVDTFVNGSFRNRRITEKAYIDVQVGYGDDTVCMHTILHETGHLIADFGGRHTASHELSSAEGFQTLYAQYGASLQGHDIHTGANMYNAGEFFAESYRLYILEPDFLKTQYPVLYDYMELCTTLYVSGN